MLDHLSRFIFSWINKNNFFLHLRPRFKGCFPCLERSIRVQETALSHSLADSLRLHLQRLIQTGQAEFFLTVNTSLVCEVTTGVDGRGGEKVHNWNT